MPLVTKTFSDIITFTRNSGATYFDSNGVLQTAGNNVPRLDYNPITLAAQGLLIEEARTNLAAYSAALNDPLGWTPQSGLTVTANAITSPDGTLSAERLASDGINTGFLDKTFSITSGTTYTFSCFFKKHNTSTVSILIYGVQFNSGGANVTGTFNLDTGVAAGVNGTAAMTSVGNGWYRCSLTKDATTTGAFTQQAVRMASSTGDVYAWGYQIEAGAFPTSYIPTTTTALTRSADVASVNTLSPWYNASASTLYTEFNTPVPVAVAGSAVVVGYDDGTANNRFSNFYTSSTGAVAANQVTGGAPNYTIAAASGVTLSNVQKQATRFQAGSYASSANGAAVVSDSFASAPPTVNTLRFGLRPSGTQANMWLRRVTVYPRGLSNAELQAITA